MRNPYRYFNTSPVIIQLAVVMYVRYPLSLGQVEDLLHERGIDVSYEAIGFGGTGSDQWSPRSSGTDSSDSITDRTTGDGTSMKSS